jgi:hypothetical protein
VESQAAAKAVEGLAAGERAAEGTEEAGSEVDLEDWEGPLRKCSAGPGFLRKTP